MDKILEELWYGNIDPMEAVGSGGPQYKELMELMARNREKIAAKLDEEMQEVLETYDDNIREMDAIAEKEAFIYGFRSRRRFCNCWIAKLILLLKSQNIF